MVISGITTLVSTKEHWRDGERGLTVLPFREGVITVSEMDTQWWYQPPDLSTPETLKAAVAEKL